MPKSKGGKDSYNNWQLLHRHCHDKKTAFDGSLGKKNVAEILLNLSHL
ncbi:MAG: HNH endonuclease [Nostoc sp.]